MRNRDEPGPPGEDLHARRRRGGGEPRERSRVSKLRIRASPRSATSTSSDSSSAGAPPAWNGSRTSSSTSVPDLARPDGAGLQIEQGGETGSRWRSTRRTRDSTWERARVWVMAFLAAFVDA